ncbi:MAG: NADAR family protein [Patescibacteria group bacterium]|nr:NADAR family protein [Patescibacteria group bacterium]MDE1944518.1 NADAR family protein [Patescibacteria group bacterium]MDE1945371.1 NADAR family protein [Patescibacteria group bacterium]MDE2057652.1 NADAR family protein [Patescibacteria group bacterium]
MERVAPEIFAIYFSPYTAHAIEVAGVLYPTVEHAYQCARYDDPAIREEIRAQPSPVKAWEVSTRYKHLQDPAFKDPAHKREVMKSLMRERALQHEEVRTALLATGGAAIVKHISTYPPGDGWWDDGAHGEGENVMGQIWMELREEFARASS